MFILDILEFETLTFFPILVSLYACIHFTNISMHFTVSSLRSVSCRSYWSVISKSYFLCFFVLLLYFRKGEKQRGLNWIKGCAVALTGHTRAFNYCSMKWIRCVSTLRIHLIVNLALLKYWSFQSRLFFRN